MLYRITGSLLKKYATEYPFLISDHILLPQLGTTLCSAANERD
ncbi:Uncharacterised protein [Legionella parisiensis]|nr:Uncharacterised protein [Legionella parisiensis]